MQRVRTRFHKGGDCSSPASPRLFLALRETLQERAIRMVTLDWNQVWNASLVAVTLRTPGRCQGDRIASVGAAKFPPQGRKVSEPATRCWSRG